MQESMKRQKIECWKCTRIFSLLIDTAGEPTLTRECPYCHAPLKLDFGGEPQNIVTVMGSGQVATARDNPLPAPGNS
jgi:hypothetical protein